MALETPPSRQGLPSGGRPWTGSPQPGGFPRAPCRVLVMLAMQDRSHRRAHLHRSHTSALVPHAEPTCTTLPHTASLYGPLPHAEPTCTAPTHLHCSPAQTPPAPSPQRRVHPHHSPTQSLPTPLPDADPTCTAQLLLPAKPCSGASGGHWDLGLCVGSTVPSVGEQQNATSKIVKAGSGPGEPV